MTKGKTARREKKTETEKTRRTFFLFILFQAKGLVRVCDTVRAVVEWREKKLVIHANREANEGKEISAVRRRRRRRRQAIKAKEETRFFSR